MSIKFDIYKTDMVELFTINCKNYEIGDTRPIMMEIRTNKLNLASFEEMFNIMVMNRSTVKDGDYQQMYDLLRRLQTNDTLFF